MYFGIFECNTVERNARKERTYMQTSVSFVFEAEETFECKAKEGN